MTWFLYFSHEKDRLFNMNSNLSHQILRPINLCITLPFKNVGLFGAQETFLILINVENSCLLNIYSGLILIVNSCLIFFFF